MTGSTSRDVELGPPETTIDLSVPVPVDRAEQPVAEPEPEPEPEEVAHQLAHGPVAQITKGLILDAPVRYTDSGGSTWQIAGVNLFYRWQADQGWTTLIVVTGTTASPFGNWDEESSRVLETGRHELPRWIARLVEDHRPAPGAVDVDALGA